MIMTTKKKNHFKTILFNEPRLTYKCIRGIVCCDLNLKITEMETINLGRANVLTVTCLLTKIKESIRNWSMASIGHWKPMSMMFDIPSIKENVE